MCIGRAHGFDFARLWLEFLQGAEAQKVVTLPQRIEADLWLLQFRPIECEHVAYRRVGMHAFEMSSQQRFHSVVVKVARFDDGHWCQGTLTVARVPPRADADKARYPG